MAYIAGVLYAKYNSQLLLYDPAMIIMIIIIRQPLCPVVGRMPQHAVSKLPCPLPYRVAPGFVQVVSPPLGWSPLTSFLVIWSPSGDMRGPSVVFEAVDMPCPGPFNFSYSVNYIYDFCPLPGPDVGLSIFVYVMLSIRLSILVCAAASLFCACLVRVQVSAPYVIAAMIYSYNSRITWPTWWYVGVCSSKSCSLVGDYMTAWLDASQPDATGDDETLAKHNQVLEKVLLDPIFMILKCEFFIHLDCVC